MYKGEPSRHFDGGMGGLVVCAMTDNRVSVDVKTIGGRNILMLTYTTEQATELRDALTATIERARGVA